MMRHNRTSSKSSTSNPISEFLFSQTPQPQNTCSKSVIHATNIQMQKSKEQCSRKCWNCDNINDEKPITNVYNQSCSKTVPHSTAYFTVTIALQHCTQHCIVHSDNYTATIALHIARQQIHCTMCYTLAQTKAHTSLDVLSLSFIMVFYALLCFGFAPTTCQSRFPAINVLKPNILFTQSIFHSHLNLFKYQLV